MDKLYATAQESIQTMHHISPNKVMFVCSTLLLGLILAATTSVFVAIPTLSVLYHVKHVE